MNIKDYLLDFYIEQNGETINKDLARILVTQMAVTDGSNRANGEKWTIEQAMEVGKKLGINWDSVSKCDWYVVLNMMYSDYYSVGRKHGFTDYNFYSELALAWFEDVDGPENKTFNYFFTK